MQIKGIYFNGKSAKAHEAILHVGSESYWLTDHQGKLLCVKSSLSLMQITPKLGTTRRVIRMADRQQFETCDLEGVSDLEKDLGVNQGFRIVSLLETRWQAVVLCFASLILLVYVSVVYGLPQFAKVVAFKIPADAMDSISHDTLGLLDKRVFQPSDLPENKKTRIRSVFEDISRETGHEYGFSLQFRKSKALGANAFALPSGLIILTDALVETSREIREIEAVLIHEIAHVTHRHAMRSVIQNTGVVVLISFLAGDVTSITSLAASIPTLLLESGYSRKFEIEADMAVGHYFLSRGWPILPYENILTRITKEGPQSEYADLLSSHPDIQERITRLRNLRISPN